MHTSEVMYASVILFLSDPPRLSENMAHVSPGFVLASAGYVVLVQEFKRTAVGTHCLADIPDSFSEISDLCVSLFFNHIHCCYSED